MFAPVGVPKDLRKREARRLRALGLPVGAIATVVGASQGSISLWTRDIILQREQIDANNQRAAEIRAASCRELNRGRRLHDQQDGRKRAQLSEPLHVAGCMLYWAEGSKSRNTVQFANSDPAMMELFVRFLRECFGLTSEDFSFTVNAYTNNGLTIDEIELFWMHRLGLSRRCARKHVTNHYPTSSSGNKRAKLPYGVCSLRVKRSTWLVQHIYGAIQAYSGIDQPDWLDGPHREQPRR